MGCDEWYIDDEEEEVDRVDDDDALNVADADAGVGATAGRGGCFGRRDLIIITSGGAWFMVLRTVLGKPLYSDYERSPVGCRI